MTALSTLRLLLIGSMFVAHTCRAQSDCPPVKMGDFPQSDLPPASFKPGSLKIKTAYSYYYGIGVTRNFKTARYLAFSELNDDSKNQPFQGADILLMLYANGYGVRRNLALCQRLTCANVGGAPAEMDLRKVHLNKMMEGDSTAVFDICDDITSGYMDGYCQSIRSERMGLERDKTLKRIQKSWTVSEITAYKKLRKEATAFFNSKVNSETDLSGSSRAAFGLLESDNLEEAFVDQTDSAGKCALHNYTPDDYKKADQQLNVIYKKIMASDEFPLGTVSKDGIKQTQRLWLAYRDAWVDFGKVKCPAVKPETWQTMMTKERVLQLKNLLDGE